MQRTGNKVFKKVSVLDLIDTPLSARKFPANFMVAEVEAMESKELGYAAHAAYRMGITHENFWRRIAARAETLGGQTAPKYAAQILFSLAEKADSRSFGELANIFASRAASARPAEIALVLKALAKRNEKSPKLMEIAKTLAKPDLVLGMSRRAALISLVSVAKLNLVDSKLIDKASEFLATEISDLSIEEIGGWLRALATTGRKLPDGVEHEIADRVISCDPQTCGEIIFSVAKMGTTDSGMAAAFTKNLSNNLGAFEVNALCFALGNLVKISPVDAQPILMRGLRRVTREIERVNVDAVAACLEATELFAQDKDISILRTLLLDNLPKFSIQEAPDLLNSALRSLALEKIHREIESLSEPEAVHLLQRVQIYDEVTACKLISERHFSFPSLLALGKHPIQSAKPLLRDVCAAVLTNDGVSTSNIDTQDCGLSAEDAEVVAAAALRIVNRDAREARSLALKVMETPELSKVTLSALVRVANACESSELSEKVLTLVHERLDTSLPCKLICRALRLCYGPHAPVQSRERVGRLVSAAVASAVQLNEPDFCAFLQILVNLGIKGETLDTMVPLTTVRHSHSGPLERCKIEKLGKTLEMDFGEIEWTRDLLDHEDDQSREQRKVEISKLKKKSFSR